MTDNRYNANRGRRSGNGYPSGQSASGTTRMPSNAQGAGYQVPRRAPQQPAMRRIPQSEIDKYRVHGANSVGSPSYGHDPKYNRKRVKRGHGKLIALVIVLVLVAAVGVSGGLYANTLYNQAQDMKTDAKEILAKINDVTANLLSSDFDSASANVKEIQQKSAQLNETLNSPLWQTAAKLPVIGEDVQAVQSMAEVLDSVTDEALVPLTSSLQETPLSSLLSDGAVNVQALDKLLTTVQQVTPAIKNASAKLNSLPETHIGQISSMVTSATEKMSKISTALDTVNQFAPILTDLLGKDGERRYLIVAQNTAEMRASDGFNGAYATMTINNGKISLSDLGGADYISDTIPSYLAMTSNEFTLFGENYMKSARNLNYNPDFERDAEIWAAAYATQQNATVDGVISVIPSVVQDILAITGSITLADGTTLDGTNATRVLSHDLYVKYLNTDQNVSEMNTYVDGLFGQAAKLAFNSMFSNLNSSTLGSFAKVLIEDATSRKVMIWMANADEENRIKSVGMSGGLNSDATQPELGVYASTGNSSKLGWYIDLTTVIGEGVKNSDGTTSYNCTTSISNTITTAEVESYSDYLVGTIDRGEPWPWLHIFAPAGGSISNFQVTQGSMNFMDGEYEGLQVKYATADSGARLAPGSTVTVSYTVTVSASATSALKLSATPTLTSYR